VLSAQAVIKFEEEDEPFAVIHPSCVKR
jgi:hypothetical protein